MALVSVNVWRLVRDTLNTTCNFMYCSHRVHKDFFYHSVFLRIFFHLHAPHVTLVYAEQLGVIAACSYTGTTLASWHLNVCIPVPTITTV
jgi:hypothetical protein